MFDGHNARHGATLVVAIGAGQLSLGVVSKINKATALELSASGFLAPEKRSSAQTAAALKQLLSDKLTSLLKTHADRRGPKIRAVFLVLEAPLSQAFVVRAQRVFPAPERVTDTLLNALGQLAHEPNFLSASMLRVQLNGYNTERPEGKYATSVDLIGLAATADPALKESLLATLRSLLPSAKIAIWPGTLALIRSTAEQGGEEGRNSLTLYVSSEGTELVAFHDGIPTTCAFIPVGTRVIAERASPGKPALSTLAALRLAAKGDISDAAAAEGEASLVRIESELAHDFGDPLARLASEQRLPPAVLLIAPQEIEEWFSRFIGRLDFAPFTMTALPFAVRAMQPLNLPSGEAPAQGDIMLALALSLLHRQDD